jgi:DNA-binding NtrC family response regulator
VRPFKSAGQALAFLAAGERCDLVLTEAAATGRGGRSLADCVWRYRPELPVLLMADDAVEDSMQRTLADGRAALLPKPFRRADLARTLRRLFPDQAKGRRSAGQADAARASQYRGASASHLDASSRRAPRVGRDGMPVAVDR